ncbi:hypothetical protein [Planifilum fimeticola]
MQLEKYTYDGFDRIAEHKKLEDDGNTSTTTRYSYDPLDRTASRTEKAGTSNEKTTVFNYLGLTDDVISETNDLTGDIQKSYTYGPWGERLSQIKHGSSAEQSFYSYNPHTDVEALTDESGTPVATYGYTAYGKLDEDSTTGKDDPRDPNEIEMKDEKIDFLVVLSENNISILFDERKEPKKIIKSGNVLFEITDNDYLSKIHVLNLSPDEYRVLLEAIK